VQVGTCQAQQGQFDDARKNYAESRAILAKLVHENPTVHDYDIAIASNLRRQGEFERAARNLTEARDVLTESLSIYQRHHRRDPNDAAVARSLAEVLRDLSLTYASLGQRDEALQYTTRAVQAYRFMVERSPEIMAYKSSLGQCLSNQANLMNLRGEFEQALEPVREAIRQQHHALSAGRPPPSLAARYLIQHYIVLWTSLRRLDRWSEHDAAMQEYLKHHDGNCAALIRAARECCECVGEHVGIAGPPSSDRIERADRFAQRAIELLRRALEIDKARAKREFRPNYFQVLKDRAEYQELVRQLQTEL